MGWIARKVGASLVLGVAGWCALWAGASARAGEPAAGERAASLRPVELRVDYLPNLIYDGERLTLCGVVVNRTGAIVNARVRATLEAGEGEPQAGIDRELGVAPGREERFEAGWQVSDLRGAASLRVVVAVAGEEADAASATLYPASDNLPELTLSDDHLTDLCGARAVLVVRRQVREGETRWAVVKWVRNMVTGGKVEPASALFVGDLLAADEAGSYVSILKSSESFRCFSFIGVPHAGGPKEAAPAILETLSEFSRSALKRQYDLAFIFVGSEEARYGTDAQEFRRAVDLMAGLLRAQGCEHVVLVCPAAPEKLGAGVERYRRALESVAYAAAARTMDPQAAVLRAGWGAGRWPRAEAQKALAAEIARLVEAVTTR